MTWHDMAFEMLRIFKMSDGMQEAHLSLIKSPFAFSVRNVWLEIYKEGIRSGRFTHIELLPSEEKKELWKSTKEICEGTEIPTELMADVSRVLYTMEFYLNIKS